MSQIHFKRRNACLLGDDMGLGKTIQAIALFNYLKFKRIIVVCPASVRGVWEGEIPAWSSGGYKIQALSGGDAKIRPDTNVVILSYQLTWRKPILRQLVASQWDLVVFDEAHALSNLKSKQTKACLGNIWEVCTNRLLLTGSVMRNKTIDLYPLCARIAPELFPGGYWGFASNYCHIEKNNFGVEILGGKNLAKLNKLLKQFTIRRIKSKVAIQLPEKLEQKVFIDCPWAEQVADDKALEDFTTESVSKAMETGHIDPELTRMRVQLGVEKVQGVCDYIQQVEQEAGQEGFHAVVFCHHRDVWSGLNQELQNRGYKVVGIHGQTPNKTRTKAKKDFQAGKAHIFLATFAAAEGITLTQSSRLFFAEMSWSLDKNDQAADRIHRMGQKKQVNIYYLLARHEADRLVYASYKQKRSIKTKVLRE